MTGEATEIHDQGVRCLYCAQPIHLSPKLARLYVVAKDETQRTQQERGSRILLLRCAKCSREAPYRVSEVITLSPSTASEAGEATSPYNPPKAFRRAAS